MKDQRPGEESQKADLWTVLACTSSREFQAEMTLETALHVLADAVALATKWELTDPILATQGHRIQPSLKLREVDPPCQFEVLRRTPLPVPPCLPKRRRAPVMRVDLGVLSPLPEQDLLCNPSGSGGMSSSSSSALPASDRDCERDPSDVGRESNDMSAEDQDVKLLSVKRP